MIGNQSSSPVQNNKKLENSKSEEDKNSKLPKFTANWFQLFCKYSEFLANFCSVNLICYKWAPCFYFHNEPHTKGQTNSKWFFQAEVSSKKQTNKFDFTTCRLVFVRFFGRKWRHQKRHSEINWPLESIKKLHKTLQGKLILVRWPTLH